MARPTGGRAHAQKKNSAQVAEEQLRCYQLRLTGATIAMIAKQTGLAVGTVHKRIQSEIAERVEPVRAEVRKVQLDRLDEWLMHLNKQIREGRSVARNIEVALRVEERRAKMMGSDEPEQSAVTVTTDPAVQALLDRARAARAAERQAAGGE
jgi:hypothetical protein